MATTPGERQGRRWLVLSFLACPCHLPLTLGILGTVFAGTALGAVLRDHPFVAGAIISAVWLTGTARGLLLVRRGQREGFACAVPGGGTDKGWLVPTEGSTAERKR
jgi:hypothetical protein